MKQKNPEKNFIQKNAPTRSSRQHQDHFVCDKQTRVLRQKKVLELYQKAFSQDQTVSKSVKNWKKSFSFLHFFP